MSESFKIFLNASQNCSSTEKLLQLTCHYDPEFCHEVKVVELNVTFVYGYNISRESRNNPGEELFHVNFTHVQTNNASYSFICLYLCPEQTGYKSEEVILRGCGT